MQQTRPERVVERYVDADQLAAARGEAARAFRSRETAWRALVEVRLLHREGTPGSCRCGQRLDRCPVAAIVERYPTLRDEHVRRAERGEPHN